MVTRKRSNRSSSLLGIGEQITDGSHAILVIIDEAMSAQMLGHEILNMYSITSELIGPMSLYH